MGKRLDEQAITLDKKVKASHIYLFIFKLLKKVLSTRNARMLDIETDKEKDYHF